MPKGYERMDRLNDLRIYCSQVPRSRWKFWKKTMLRIYFIRRERFDWNNMADNNAVRQFCGRRGVCIETNIPYSAAETAVKHLRELLRD